MKPKLSLFAAVLFVLAVSLASDSTPTGAQVTVPSKSYASDASSTAPRSDNEIMYAAVTGDTTQSKPADSVKAKPEPAKGKAKSTPAAAGDKGIGPVKDLKLGPVDDMMVAHGQQVFTKKCTVCHMLDSKKIGPPLRGITQQQTPEFIMNMMLNSEEMEQKNAQVKKLISQYQTYMTLQGMTQDDARAVLEYLRSEESKDKTK